MHRRVVPAVAIGLSVLVGLVLAEIVYRAYLGVTQREAFFPSSGAPLPPFGVYDRTRWVFNPDYGFDYPAGSTVHLTNIDDGRVASCSSVTTINELGNVGRIEGRYADAALKIAVFGDSFSVFHHDGVNWPLLFQRKLAARLGTSVHVLNFARDGIGIAQMLDVAAAKVPEWQPDIAVFAFITDDINRARIWRAAGTIDGEERVLTSLEPSATPDPSKGIDTAILHPGATPAWCESAKGKQERDTVVAQAEDRYRRLRGQIESAGGARGLFKRPSFYTVTTSYVGNAVLFGDPFRSSRYRWNPGHLPRLDYADFRLDQRFLANLSAVKASVPLVAFLHLPYYPELKAGREMTPDIRQAALLRSLESLLDEPVRPLARFIQPPLEDPARMNAAPDNYHPSPFGIEVYSDAAVEALLGGSLGERVRRLSARGSP